MSASGRYWRGEPLAVALVAMCAWGDQAGTAQSCTDPWSNVFGAYGELSGPVNAFAVFDAELYIGGEFAGCMRRTVNYVARWNGRRWARVGAGLYDPNSPYALYVYALTTFDDPNSAAPTLYAGAVDGVYTMPDDPNDPNAAWPRVAATDAPVRALAVYDGALYVGGEFSVIDPNDGPPISAATIGRWNGASWEEVGGGVGSDPNDPNSPPAKVLALTVFDFEDGGGPALFAGGTFLTAGGLGAKRVARWRSGACL